MKTKLLGTAMALGLAAAPFAAIAGGVGGSAILALYTVPAVYQMFTRHNANPPQASAEVEAEISEFPIPLINDRVRSS